MRVLVTGAAGFLGRHFVHAHSGLGDEIVALDDLSGHGAAWPPETETRIQADAATCLHALGQLRFDRVYHFAAPVGGREKIEGDPLFNAYSLAIDAAMFRWAINHTAQLVYPSSSAVYGAAIQGHDNSPSLRESLCDPLASTWWAPDEMYGFTKLAGEVLAAKAARYGLSTLCLRPFSGYGEGQSADYPVTAICQRAVNREDPLTIWGSGEQSRDFIHVDDLVAATLARLDAGVKGYQVLNIGTGLATSFRELASLAASLVGYSPRIVSDESKPVGVYRRCADVTEMRRYYTPRITLEAGLARVIASLSPQ